MAAGRHAHSLHAYFLRRGRVDEPLDFAVERIRDGRSFTTRRVVARQGERPIFNLAASFQVEEPGLEHQAPMPEAPEPEVLRTERELCQEIAARLPESLRAGLLAERALSLWPIDPLDVTAPDARPPQRMVWYQAPRPLPDDPALQRCLLAYGSDFHFLSTALYPHGLSWLIPGLQIASLDHAIWFHRPFKLEDGLLHVVDSPTTAGARGLVRGQFFSRDGRLVASTTQEGLLRDRRSGRKARRAP